MSNITGTNGNNNLTGTNAADLIKGLNGQDYIRGLGGNDIIDGGAGIDTMMGGKGNDTYYVDNTKDVISEKAGEGYDKVYSSVSYALSGNIESLILTGSANISARGNNLGDNIAGNIGNNVIYGGTGNDIIDGNAGADTMIGGKGNDVYYVDNTKDTVTEIAGGGNDTVYSSISYTLSNNVENLILTGAGDLVATANNNGSDIVGNSGNNILNGGSGNDLLDGGTGYDSLIGGIGDDTYYIDNENDTVVENESEGNDTVYSSVSCTLVDNVENLILTGDNDLTAYAGNQSCNIAGNAGSNEIYGGDGNDILNGGLGADTLTGGTGDDTYYIDNINDVISEKSAEGIDTVYSSISYTVPDNIEKLVLIGNDNLVAYANNSGDTILGNDGNDTIYGGKGNDMFFVADNMYFVEHIEGSNGSNTIYGDKGNDMYFVNDVNDIVVENPNEGKDSVYTNLTTYTLPDNVENGYLITVGDRDLYGNSLNNELHGNCYNNFIFGDIGNDSIYGGGYGHDTLVGGEGNDKLMASLRDGLLYGGNGADTLIGSEGNDSLCGSAGSDVYSGFARNLTGYHYNIGFGNDVIDDSLDYLNNQQVKVSGSPKDVDILDLTSFNKSDMIFSKLDLDRDGKIDGLLVNAGQFGTVRINHYFDDSSRYISSSHSGELIDIYLNHGIVLHFSDIQGMLH